MALRCARLHETRRSKLANRFAHRRTRHAKAAGDFHFLKRHARSETAAHNLVSDQVA